MPVDHLLATLGTAFIKTRNLPLILLLPIAAIGLLERHGLKSMRRRRLRASARPPPAAC
jgi:uncharacterized membrane protein